jgi:hypothetical protein
MDGCTRRPNHALQRHDRPEGGGEGKRKPEGTLGASTPNEHVVPLLLSLPNCLTKQLIDRAYWMPHEVLEKIDDLIQIFDLQFDKGAWEVSRDWCCAACQARSALQPTTSFVSITIDAVIQADEDLADWIDRRLDMMLGQRSQGARHQDKQANAAPPTPLRTPSPKPAHSPSTQGDIAIKVGKGIALDFQAWSNAALATTLAGGGGEPHAHLGGSDPKGILTRCHRHHQRLQRHAHYRQGAAHLEDIPNNKKHRRAMAPLTLRHGTVGSIPLR